MNKKLLPPVPPSMAFDAGLEEVRSAASDPTLYAPTMSAVVTPAHRRFETIVTDSLERIDDMAMDAKKGFDDNVKTKPEIAIKFQRNQIHIERLRVHILAIAADMVVKDKERYDADAARKDIARDSMLTSLPTQAVQAIAAILARDKTFEGTVRDVTPANDQQNTGN